MKRRSLGDERAKRLFSYLDDSVDSVLILNEGTSFQDENFRYLTDAQGGTFEHSIAIATRRGVSIITSRLEEQIARRTGCRTVTYSSSKQMAATIRKALREKRAVGINERGLSYASVKWLRSIVKGTKFKDVSKQLMEMRMIKTEEEILRLRRAARIASRVAVEIPQITRLGMTEREMAAEIDYLLRRHGADSPAFDTIAAFGPSSAMPHHMSGGGRLKSGSVALFDFGARRSNYVSDITRTILTRPGDRQLERIYAVVLEAQQAAMDEMRSGTPAKEIDAVARDIISRAGFGERFTHSLGHGLGVSPHDPGSLSSRSDMVLREGMVLTVEPGVYIPRKGGVRIEDAVLVTANGARLLTRASREMLIF